MKTTFDFERTSLAKFFRLYQENPTPVNLKMLHQAVDRWGTEMRRPLVAAITTQELPVAPALVPIQLPA